MTNDEVLDELRDIVRDGGGTSKEDFRLALACIKETRGDMEEVKSTMTEQFRKVGDTLDNINTSMHSIDAKVQIISEKMVRYDVLVEQAKRNPMLRLGNWMSERPKEFSFVFGSLVVGGVILSTVWNIPSVRLVVFEWLHFPNSLITLLMP